MQVLGRGPGRRNQHGGLKVRPDNVVAAAAYRAGARLVERGIKEGRIHDYSRKRGVAHAEVLAPVGAADWLSDRQQLWAHVEAMEKRVDAQLAREVDMALPHELTRDQRIDLVREYVLEHFVSQGMVADLALHEPVAERGDDPRNHHAHVMLTLRRATSQGLDPVKTRAWNAREQLGVWRTAWEAHVNSALERHGHNVRIDHRTLASQAEEARARGRHGDAEILSRAPELHVGPRARALDRKRLEPRSRLRVVGAPRRDTTRAERRAMQDRLREGSIDKEVWKDARYQDWLSARQAEWERRREEDRRVSAATRREINKRAWQQGRGVTTPRRVSDRFAFDRLLGSQADRRVCNYPSIDRGSRKDLLTQILSGNTRRVKHIIQRMESASTRLDRWLDYYDRKLTWLMETRPYGRATQSKITHAQYRAAFVRDVVAEVRSLVAALLGQQERMLVRQLQIEHWSRALDRKPLRDLPGRTRPD